MRTLERALHRVWEAQPQAVCMSKVRNCVILYEGYFQASCSVHHDFLAHKDMVLFSVLCAVKIIFFEYL